LLRSLVSLGAVSLRGCPVTRIQWRTLSSESSPRVRPRASTTYR
jgi:hypothetical protein